MSKFTLVFYYVPEDKDDPTYPNAFGINLAQEDIKLKDLKAAFPLDGEYHFRFKYKLNGQTVFMDLPSESSGLPLFDGKIFMKATRISWGKQTKGSYGDEDVERQKFYSDTEELKRGHSKGVADAGKHRSQSQPQHHDQPHHQYQQAKPSGFSNNDYDLLGTGTTSSTQAKPSTTTTSSYSKDLLDDFGTTTTSTPKTDYSNFGAQGKTKATANNLMEFDHDLV